MLAIIRFLRGYVRVYLWGFSPERFMNLCNNRGIELWAVEPKEDGYEFFMYIGGFFACRDFLRKTKTRVVIRKKLGLPFFLFRYRKRKLFFVGLLGCFLALFLATRFIWAFEITGNRRFTDDMYLAFLESQQVYYGMPIGKLDIDEFEKQLREQYDYITWASAKIEGTKLHVMIKENDVFMQPEEAEQVTGDIRAAASGTIVQMVTRSGVPVTKPGDAVNEGDVLISGIIPIYNDDETLRTYHVTKADGDVYIESVFPISEELLLYYDKKVYTGNRKRLLVLGFGEKELKLGKVEMQEAYEILSDRKPIRLFDNLYLPIIYGHNEYVGYELVKSTYSQEEAREILSQRFLRICATLEEKGVQIIEKDVKIEIREDRAVLYGSLIIRQNAVTLTPIIEFPEENSIEQ